MKRALIITYYWPPAGGPGVQRWLKFVKYFRDYGIEPVVYAPENPSYPLIDEDFVSEIPQGIEIIKTPIREPYRLAKVFSKKKTKQFSSGIISKKDSSLLEKSMLYIRGNFFIPDARIGWVKPSVNYLSTYLSKNPVDVLITTGPPHSMHLIGMELKKKTGVKWIADFRDPWTTIHYHSSLKLNKKSQQKHKGLEALVLNTADEIVVTSPSTKKEFEAITKKPISVITNGYDTDEKIQVSVDSKFSISHIGSLLSGRNPKILWEVLEEISQSNPLFKSDLKLKFAGAVSEEVKESLAEKGLIENTEFLGYISHKEAIEQQHSSQILLLVEIDSEETRAILPGKLYEYMVANRPIIALGPEDSDIEEIIKNTETGKFFTYKEKLGLKEIILKYYKEFNEGSLKIQSREIVAYSRKELTKRFSELIFKG